MKTGIIYCAENLLNGKRYIGQTIKSLAKRKSKHLAAAFIHGIDCKFYQALKKYGEDSFSWAIVEEVPIEKLDEREAFWISKYRTLYEGYNMTEGGPTLIGHKHTEETKKRISESLKGKSMKDHYIETYGEDLGLKRYKEYIEKLNKANGKGKTRLELFIERNGEIEGRKKYEIFIQSIKDARKRSPSGFKGKKMSKKQKEQIGKNTSEKLRGKPKSEEHKKKISEARKKYWEQKKRLI